MLEEKGVKMNKKRIARVQGHSVKKVWMGFTNKEIKEVISQDVHKTVKKAGMLELKRRKK